MKRPAVALAAALLVITSALIGYRIFWLKYPPFPSAPGKAWELSMSAEVKGDEAGSIRATVALPDDQEGRVVTEEQINSGSLSFELRRKGENRLGVWSGSVGPDVGIIGYRATIAATAPPSTRGPSPELGPYPAVLDPEERALARSLASRWATLEPRARLRAAAAAAAGSWTGTPPEGPEMEAWTELERRRGPSMALLALLRAAGLAARSVEGLRLSEALEVEPFPWVEAWTGRAWERVDPRTGELLREPPGFLPLAKGEAQAVQASRGEVSKACWTLTQGIVSRWRVHFERISTSDRFLDRWSLFRLPEQFQETFRILLLVPIGALLICVLRNMVGFPTFGIFMPVLMALAFRNTGLAYGLGIFGGVVLLGYLVRRSLDRLRLLMVPRLSLMLTLVIAAFTLLALWGSKVGLRELMAVGLLPFVILTMTIERAFVIIEEAGPREGLRTAAGSAAVATITYQLLHWEALQLTFFVYPELLLAVAAFQLLVGRYTGYRLSELLRFGAFRREP
jgi:hypothetical protein